jgi:hypothetical protein
MNVEQSVVRRWRHLADQRSTTSVAANEEVVPVSEYDVEGVRCSCEQRLGC